MMPGMDFHNAFQAIDTDNSGEITVDELQEYCKKMNYKETFVQKWLNLFDEDQSGTITYEEFCNTLGLVPKKEVVHQHKQKQQEQQEKPQKKQLKKPKDKSAMTSAAGRVRNFALSGSLMRHSRARMFQRKAIYRLVKAKAPRVGSVRSRTDSQVTFTRKEVGGEKNGGSRNVPSRRQPKSLETQKKPKVNRVRPAKSFREHKRRLRASITPGTVLILLAGRHRGKRVVFLRQLPSGLLLVTGPMRLNGCPLRRVGQKFAIATGTKVDVDAVQVPERVNDKYFRRAKKAKKSAGDSGDIFAQEKAAYQLTAERREDQKSVDSQLLAAIAKREDKRLLAAYLKSLFCLKSGDRPHAMVF